MRVDLKWLLVVCLTACNSGTSRGDAGSGGATPSPATTDTAATASPSLPSDTAPADTHVTLDTAVSTGDTAPVDTGTASGTAPSTDTGACGDSNDAPCGGCPAGQFCMDCSYYAFDTATGGTTFYESVYCAPCDIGTRC